MQLLLQSAWGTPETPWRLHISGFKDEHGLAQSDVANVSHENVRFLEDSLAELGFHTAAAGLAQMRHEHEAYLQKTVDQTIDTLTKARAALGKL